MWYFDRIASILPYHIKVKPLAGDRYIVFFWPLSKVGYAITKRDLDILVVLFWGSFIALLVSQFFVEIYGPVKLYNVISFGVWTIANGLIHFYITRGKQSLKEE